MFYVAIERNNARKKMYTYEHIDLGNGQLHPYELDKKERKVFKLLSENRVSE
jgi:hypothetical protein